jgi:hypothetical protein
MATLATTLFSQDLDVLLVFAARADDAINAGEVRYRDREDFAATVAALTSHMPSLDGVSIVAESMTIVATEPARKALYYSLCGSGPASFDAAIQIVKKTLLDTLVMFSKTDTAWRTHPAFAGKEQEWDFLGSDYVVLDWLVDDTPFRFRFYDVRTGQPHAPQFCASAAAARPLTDGRLAFLVSHGSNRLALVCPRAYLPVMRTRYDRSIVAATMLIARLGFLMYDFGFGMNPTGTSAKGLLELFKLGGAAGLDLPQDLIQTLSAYHQACEVQFGPAGQIPLRKRCLRALLQYSRPWLHESDSHLASLFRGWMVTVEPGALVDRRAIVCPGATICGGSTILAGAIVRNGARVAPYAVLAAGQIATASGEILKAGGNAKSSDDVTVPTRGGGPDVLTRAPQGEALVAGDDLARPIIIADAPATYPTISLGEARSSGSVSSRRYPVAGDAIPGGAESGAQNAAVQSPLSTTTESTTTTTTTTSTMTPPPLPRKRPRSCPETEVDSAPPSSRQRTTPPGWPEPGADPWPYPEVTGTHPRLFTWTNDTTAMPTRQMSTLPARIVPSPCPAEFAPAAPLTDAQPRQQNLAPESRLALTPPRSERAPSTLNLPSIQPARPYSRFRIDATPPSVHNRELPSQQAVPSMEHTVLPNDVLQFTRLPPPTYAPAPVLYSGRGGSRAAPFENGPDAAPQQPVHPTTASLLQPGAARPSPVMPRFVANQFMFNHM